MSSEDVYKEYSQRTGKAQQANQVTKKTLLTNTIFLVTKLCNRTVTRSLMCSHTNHV